MNIRELMKAVEGHTEAPWDAVRVAQECATEVKNIYHDKHAAYAYGSNHWANAALIAASPDLLALCVEQAEILESFAGLCGHTDEAEPALGCEDGCIACEARTHLKSIGWEADDGR